MIYKGGMPLVATKVRRHAVVRAKITRQQDYQEQLDNIKYQNKLLAKEVIK